jgi:hypothetical protein
MKRLTTGWALTLAAMALAQAAGAVTLRCQYKVGDERKYDSTLAAEGTLAFNGPLGNQALPFNVGGNQQTRLKVTEAAADGTFWVESRTLKSTISLKGAADMAGGDPDAGGGVAGGGALEMPKLAIRSRMDTGGNVLESEVVKDDKAKDDKANKDLPVDLDLDQVLNLSQLSGFPAGDLAVGGTWDKELTVKTKDGKVLKGKVTSKLVAVNGDEARIESHYETPIPPTEGVMKLGMDLPIKLEGKVVGNSTVYFSLGRGIELRSEGSAQVDLKLTLVGLGDPADGHFTVTTKTTLAP